MKRSSIAIAVLAAALVASNVWWAYLAIDRGISRAYLQATYDTDSALLKQALAVLAKPAASKAEILAAVRGSTASGQPYDKDGFVWVGELGLKFDSYGHLVKAIAGPQ